MLRHITFFVNQSYLNWINFQTVMGDGVQKTACEPIFIFPVSPIGFNMKLYFNLCDDPLHKHFSPVKGCWRTLFEIVPLFGQMIVFM